MWIISSRVLTVYSDKQVWGFDRDLSSSSEMSQDDEGACLLSWTQSVILEEQQGRRNNSSYQTLVKTTNKKMTQETFLKEMGAYRQKCHDESI